MNKVSFDGPNSLIYIITGSTILNVESELYSEWKRWLQTGSNGQYQEALRTVGGDPISGVLSLGATFFLMNGWKLRPYDGVYELVINGNLYDNDGGNIMVPPTSSDSNVLARLQTSNLIDYLLVEATSSAASVDRVQEITEDITASLDEIRPELQYLTSSINSMIPELQYVTSSVDSIQLTLNLVTSSLTDIDNTLNVITSSLGIIEGYTLEMSGSLVTIGDNIITIGNDLTIVSSSLVTLDQSVNQINTNVTSLSASISDHRLETEDRIKYILGLSQQNFRMKDQIYDVNNNMVTATVRTYISASDATADTNYLKQYAVSSSYTGDLLTSYTMTEI